MVKKMIKISRPEWLRPVETAFGLYPRDLCILEREALSDRPTYALAWDRGGRTFPMVWVVQNMSISCIKNTVIPQMLAGITYAAECGWTLPNVRHERKSQIAAVAIDLGMALLNLATAPSADLLADRQRHVQRLLDQLLNLST